VLRESVYGLGVVGDGVLIPMLDLARIYFTF
jgi:hypothetical protein